MADPQTNPFDDIADNGVRSTNPFDRIGGDDLAAPTSATGAFVRGGVRGVLPAIGGIIGGQVGGEIGGALGAGGGPVTAFGGAVAGGLGGAYLGSTAVSYAQHWALSKLPDSWREAIGMDDRQERLDEGQHPIASFLGGIAPYAVTMNPTSAAKKALPANATAMQRVMAHPATARVFGGAAMGGFELGQEAVGPDPIDWRKVAISTGMGVVFNRPNVIGQRIGEVGAGPARRMFGLPSPVHAAPAPAQPATVVPPSEAPAEASPARIDRGIAPSLFHATIAQAGDAKVMGPGVTEEVFHGTHEMNDAARLSTQEDARVEASVIGPEPQPDLHSLARRSTPDLFAHYDALRGQENDFTAWLAGHPADTAAQNHLAAVQHDLAALEPQVAAAYRRAGELTGQPAIEATSGEVAPANENRPIEAQKAFIAEDVAEQLERAGRPHDEAVAAGHLIAARYEARAAMFKGALGSAEDLYRREGAEILKSGQKSTQYLIRAPRKVNVPALSLFQFLAHRGGLAPHSDLQHILGENPFVPGFGRLVRKGGMTLDRAREAAVEAGYLHDQGAIEGRESESTINQLLDAIDREGRGNRVFRAGHTPAESDVVFDALAPEEREALARGETVPEARSPLMTEDDYRAIEELFQRKQPGEEPNLFAEREAEGQQNLPGTERITQGELAQRAADAALKPKVAQKPMDEGLFGDETAQKELFQLAYHGTDAEFREFRLPGGRENAIFFSSREDQAERFGNRIIKADLPDDQIETYRYRDFSDGDPIYDPNVMEKILERARADGVKIAKITGVQNFEHGVLSTTYAVSDPSLAKIISQRVMEFNQAARGKIRLQEGTRPVITLMRDANASTFIHETGHEWLEQLMRDAAHALAPDNLKADAAAVLKWLNVDTAGDIGRRQHERFARGFEQYMREGIAPSAGLANVFARFKSWLTAVYQTIKGLGAPISDDIRRVFDRMIAAEGHGAVIAPERTIARSMADEHELDAAHAAPQEADPWADRVATEAERAHIGDSEFAHDYEAWLAAKAEHEATGPEPGAGAGAEPVAGQAGPGGGETGELHGVRPGSENVAPVGGNRHATGAERAGGTGAAGEGAGAPAGGAELGPGAGHGDVPLAPTPAARFEPVDERVTDLAGNIRVDNLTSVEDIAQAIHDSAERNADFAGVRGSMTKGQMMDLADAMGLDASKINEANLASLLGGTANLAPRILAARKLVVQSAGLVSEAMKAAATGGDAEVAHLAMVIARHDMIQGVLAGATAEWGRAGSAFHSLMEGWGTAQAVDDFLKANTGRTLFQLKQIAKLGTQLDTPGKVSKYLRDAQHRSFGGMILEYWINGLISGPATHTTYMIGNAILAAEKAGPETAAAALIGSLRKAMGREGETVRLGEVGAQFRAAARNLPGAIEAGLEGLRSGMTTLLPGEAARPLIPFSGDTSLVTARGATNAPVSWADVGSQMFASVRSVRDGLMSGAALIAAGGERGAPLLGWHWSPLGQIPDVAIRGVPAIPVGSALRVPGRFIAAIHSFFRMTNYSMEKARLAYRTAANEGLTGTAFDARVADVWQNPSEAVMEQARKEATNLTLMGEGGAFVKALSQLTNAKVTLPVLGEFAPLKFIDPFVHIGANVINQSIVQRSPVGLLSKEIRADLMGRNGTIAQDTAMARMLVGTALSVAFGGLAAQGLASGSGPKDPKEAAMWRLAGNQAHSVRIGDMWIDVHRLGPMGMLMGVAADMYDVAHQVGEQEYLEAASHLHHAIVQNVLDESFMRGPSELIRAVEDPGRYGDAYIRNMLASFVPFSVGMAQVARASDPYSRQARSVVDAMIAKVPGYSESLLPRRDIWGEPMANLRTLGPQGLLAVWTKQVNADPVNRELYDLGIFPGQVPRKIRNVDLTDQEFDDFARIAGRMTKMRLDTIVRSPDWRTWPNHAKVSVVQEIIRQSRETARGVMMARYPHIPKHATAAKLEALND